MPITLMQFGVAASIDPRLVDANAPDERNSLVNRLVRDAKLVGGTTTVLARVPIGLAVKSGAPHPDISSVEAVKRTLLDAKSIAYVDPASGGTSRIFLASPGKARHRCRAEIEGSPRFADRRSKLASGRRDRPAR